jgi:hypothetical protein
VGDVTESVRCRHVLGPDFYCIAFDFDSLSTFTTDQVMVMSGAAVAIGTFTITTSDEVHFLRVDECA